MSSIAARSTSLDFAGVRALAADDMKDVDALIRHRLSSDVVLINRIADHIIAGGGKRLRPMLHVLAARAAGYEGSGHAKLAAIVEFIHTSTLLHDDVVDESDMRRGRKTANALWGNAASVLVGDFLYSRSFQLMVELDDMRIMRILADTTNTIAEGEVLQLLNIGNADVDEAAYLAVIERKTAVLFAAATELGGVLGGLPDAQTAALRRYGMELGYAFQIADDLLDYVSDAETLGKNIGDDLAEGKPTLPLIYAMQTADDEDPAEVAAPRHRTRRARFARSHRRRHPRLGCARAHARKSGGPCDRRARRAGGPSAVDLPRRPRGTRGLLGRTAVLSRRPARQFLAANASASHACMAP